MILIASLFLIAFEAIYEGLYDRRLKTLSGVVEGLYRIATTSAILLWLSGVNVLPFSTENLFYVFGGYVLTRFALFDIIYNAIRKLPLFHIGTTKIYDKIWQKFFKWSKFPPAAFLSMFKLISLLIGIVWLLK